MSHFTEMEVSFEQKNEKALIAALEEQFGKGTIEFHEEGGALIGYHGDDRSRLSQKDPNYAPLCNIIVRRKNVGSASNDVGYRRTEDGRYVAYISEYDKGGNFNVSKQNAVKQYYTAEVTTQTLKSRGYIAKVQKQDDGTIKIIGSKIVK